MVQRAVILSVLIAACARVEPATTGPVYAVTGVALAGPTCPVETDPPDPACAPRPVEGAIIEVVGESGEVVTSVTTGADGSFSVELPDGAYRLVPGAVEGLLGTAGPVDVVVAGGAVEVGTLEYDTGIR